MSSLLTSENLTLPLALRHAIFTIESAPDQYGRQRFTLEWDTASGKRGQCFNAHLAPHVEHMRANGFEVRINE